MLVIRTGIYKMPIKIANGEDHDQIFRSSLIGVCAVCLIILIQKPSDLVIGCLSRAFCSHLVFEILDSYTRFRFRFDSLLSKPTFFLHLSTKQIQCSNALITGIPYMGRKMCKRNQDTLY